MQHLMYLACALTLMVADWAKENLIPAALVDSAMLNPEQQQVH